MTFLLCVHLSWSFLQYQTLIGKFLKILLRLDTYKSLPKYDPYTIPGPIQKQYVTFKTPAYTPVGPTVPSASAKPSDFVAIPDKYKCVSLSINQFFINHSVNVTHELIKEFGIGYLQNPPALTPISNSDPKS